MCRKVDPSGRSLWRNKSISKPPLWSHWDETQDCGWMGSGICVYIGVRAEVSVSQIFREANQRGRGDIRAKLFTLPRGTHGRPGGGVRPPDFSSRSTLALCQFRDERKEQHAAVVRSAETGGEGGFMG